MANNTYLSDPSVQDYDPKGFEMQLHQQSIANHQNNHNSDCSRIPCLDTIPQKSSPSSALSGGSTILPRASYNDVGCRTS